MAQRTDLAKQITSGSRVAGGSGNDRSTGIVWEIRGDKALVGWDGGDQTWHPLADLTLTNERWSGGYRVDPPPWAEEE